MPTAANIQAGERYTIRRKILKIFGAAFHVFGENGELVGFCKQKAFKLREDIRIYRDEEQTEEYFALSARTILDFSTTYDISMDGQNFGSLRRKGLKSTFFRDEWEIFRDENEQIGRIIEDSGTLAVLRRFGDLGAWIPQKFRIENDQGVTLAILRTHFNPFVYRLGVTVVDESDERFDDFLFLAAACLVAAIEGRQN